MSSETDEHPPPSLKERFIYWTAEAAERDHAPDCKWRRAILCTTPIECPHGYDVCPKCDPCTCGERETTER